jgi:anti-sigma factor RsiW
MGARTLDHVSELLSPYVDGQVSPEERQRVEAHLASCAECAAELADLRALKAALSRLPQRAVPRSFAIGPRALRPAALSGAVGGWVRALSSVAAAVVVVALGVSLAIQGLPRQSSVAAPAQAEGAQARDTQAAAPAQPRAATGAAQAPSRQATGLQGQAPQAPAQAPASEAQPPTAAQPQARAAGASSASGQSAQQAGSASAARPPVNVPRLAGEIVLLLAALGFGLYSIRWWRA